MRKIRAFKHEVLSRDDGSTFAVCTLPMAPSLTDIKKKSCRQDWNLGVKAMKMYQLNEAIKAKNRPPVNFVDHRQSLVPRFHAQGLLTDKRCTRPHEKKGNWFYKVCYYRYTDWREEDRPRMLHCDDRTRLRAGKCVVKYFLKLYGITTQQLTQDPEESQSECSKSDNITSLSTEKPAL